MDAIIKQRWLEALRSGRYSQGTGRLKAAWPGNIRYCCLGVLCDVVNPTGWDQTSTNTFVYKNAWEQTNLPASLQMDLGISYDATLTLQRLNDAQKKDFGFIADWIEKNL